MKGSGESSTTKHRLLHASGSHPIPPPNDPKTNQYNQDLGLIHSKNGNHLESPNEGSSIDHQVTIHLHAQNITMFPTNETCARAKRCRINLCKRHRFAIANPKYRLLVNISFLLIVMSLLMTSSMLSAPADLYRSSSSLRLFLASIPAGPFAPADLSSYAEHDVVTDYIIIDGPLRCSSWFSFDVPAGIQLAVGAQPLRLRNHNFEHAQRIMVKRLATSRHDPLDSIGYPYMKASGESLTTKHRLLHASGSHPIPPPNDPKRVGKWVKVRRLSCRVSMTFRIVRTNQYNQDLGLIHSTNVHLIKTTGKHLDWNSKGTPKLEQLKMSTLEKSLNGPREQASNIVALGENNRAKLIKDKPARPEKGQLGEEKTESGDLVKLDAYERDEAAGRIISLDAKKQASSMQRNKLVNEQASSMQRNKLVKFKQAWKEQEQLCTRADDKSKLEISSSAVANKSRLEIGIRVLLQSGTPYNETNSRLHRSDRCFEPDRALHSTEHLTQLRIRRSDRKSFAQLRMLCSAYAGLLSLRRSTKLTVVNSTYGVHFSLW
ncbi:protein furry-like [Dorcoceras hygrometricum]|uniref:Protein furry-like n=1 Tax=Dorcoceras hygrometricum TaxID=472368 RepID=A0A2Z7BBG9_9LAMI|nr:protein furry-like [Dorcoceras hygrometricum]